MRVAAAILAIAGMVVVAWGIGLIVKTTTGDTPDSSTGVVVGMGALAVAVGVALVLYGASLGRRRT